ncbi:hypothetical protein GORHZ_170_00080 [Gordonia rhizosphera NBRC 16068]|uniref:Uncharacterized protein n=1 Tax=Gordonia rhizosphera NBRC 16068 TaxID=1108045 RepID=K6X0M5_9ACTN|nr:hypothetical protein GORHZ_170_00080 [Gordonia rhizosphera NBRC 16068]
MAAAPSPDQHATHPNRMGVAAWSLAPQGIGVAAGWPCDRGVVTDATSTQRSLTNLKAEITSYNHANMDK